MAARRLGTLMAHFEALQDPRVERTRKHSLLDIIAIAPCAVIGGADSWGGGAARAAAGPGGTGRATG